MFTTRKRGIQAWEKTTRFDFERECLADTEPDDRRLTQYSSSDRGSWDQVGKAYESGTRGGTAIRHTKGSSVGTASLARTGILVDQRLQSWQGREWRVDQTAESHRTDQGWVPNARLVPGSMWCMG